MATATETATQADHAEGTDDGADGFVLVDPRAPRFGQTLTTLGFGSAIALDLPVLVYAVTVVMTAAVISGWRIDLYAFLWRNVMLPFVGKPVEREAAAPHRFARVMGAIFGILGSALLLAGLPLAGYAAVGIVVVLAGLAAATGICLGCKMYRQVQFFQRLGLV